MRHLIQHRSAAALLGLAPWFLPLPRDRNADISVGTAGTVGKLGFQLHCRRHQFCASELGEGLHRHHGVNAE